MDELGSKRKVEELTTIKVLIEAPHKCGFTPAQCDEFWDSVYNIERVGPHVALRPSVLWSGPGTTRIARFHEASGVVKDGARSKFGAIPEEVEILRPSQQISENRDRVIVV
jgi:hypothetical protein